MAQIIYDFLKQGYTMDEIVFELEDIGYDSLTIALSLDNIHRLDGLNDVA